MPKPHRAAHIDDAALIGHEMDDRIRRHRVDLHTVRADKPCKMTRRLGDGHLHAVANTEEGNVVLTGIAGGDHLAFGAARPEARCDDDTGDATEEWLRVVLLKFFGVDPFDLDGEVLRECRVLQRLRNRDI